MDYGTPVKIPDGRYYLKTSRDDKRIFIQLNKLVAPSFAEKTLSFQIGDQKSTIQQYEQDIVSKAVEQSESWFGRKVSEETIKKAFQSSLSGDQFDTSFVTLRGEIQTSFFAADRQPKDKDSGWAQIYVIVELTGVWFLKKSFGPIFKIVQVKESRAPQKKYTSEYLFTDEPEVEEDPNDYLD